MCGCFILCSYRLASFVIKHCEEIRATRSRQSFEPPQPSFQALSSSLPLERERGEGKTKDPVNEVASPLTPIFRIIKLQNFKYIRNIYINVYILFTYFYLFFRDRAGLFTLALYKLCQFKDVSDFYLKTIGGIILCHLEHSYEF